LISIAARASSSSVIPSHAAIRAVLALIRRDYRERRTFRFAVALDLVFGMLNLVVYFYISHVLRHTSVGQLHGAHSYFEFAAVGLAYVLVIQAATAGLARRVRDEEMTGTLEALCAQPLPSSVIAFGLAGFPYLFAMARASGYLVIANLTLGLGISHPNWLGAILTILISGFAVMAIGIVLAAIVVAVGTGAQIAGVAVFALGFLGGAYFPVSVLPESLRRLSYLAPTRYALDALRGSLYARAWLGSLLILVGFTAVALPASLLAFRVALRVSARRGTLTRG
jgi:ABC-type multidrug transport system permease subunit